MDPHARAVSVWYRIAGLISREQKTLAVEIIEAEIRSAQHEVLLERPSWCSVVSLWRSLASSVTKRSGQFDPNVYRLVHDALRYAGLAASAMQKTHAPHKCGEKQRHGRVLFCRRGVMAKITLTKREPTHVEIANRAFEIYVSRGGEHGHDAGDWFEPERQLRTEFQAKKRSHQAR